MATDSQATVDEWQELGACHLCALSMDVPRIGCLQQPPLPQKLIFLLTCTPAASKY